MLIYLDANLVIYFADYGDFIFEDADVDPTIESNLLNELRSLKKIVEIEQLGDGWNIAVSEHLLNELHRKLKPEQQETINTLITSWEEYGWYEANHVNEKDVLLVEHTLIGINLKSADRRHLAEAITLGATWFLTNDKRLINCTRSKKSPNEINVIQGVSIAKPSECIEELSRGLFLK